VPVVHCVDTAVFFCLGTLLYVYEKYLLTLNICATGNKCCASVKLIRQTLLVAL